MLRQTLVLAAAWLASAAAGAARPPPFLSSMVGGRRHAPPASPPLPVVLWHGMGDSCCDPHSLGALASAITEAMGPSSYVLSLSPGAGGGDSSPAADVAAGFFGRVDAQVAAACAAIAADPRIRRAGAYDAVGFSQGGQFLRGVAQRCGGHVEEEEGRCGDGGEGGGAPGPAPGGAAPHPHHPQPHARSRPAMRRLITLGAQHQGVASLPLCPLPRNASAHAWSLCAAAAALAAAGVDAPFVRTHLIQAQYYRDPYHLPAYRRLNAFLADINNEHACDAPPPGSESGGEGAAGAAAPGPAPLPARCPNPCYARALASLDRLVLIRFARDQTVVPRDSAWFADLRVGPGGGLKAVPARESDLYREDWIGLRALDEKGALLFEEAPGGHMQFGVDWFVDRVVRRHLMGEGPAAE